MSQNVCKILPVVLTSSPFSSKELEKNPESSDPKSSEMSSARFVQAPWRHREEKVQVDWTQV